MHAPDTFPNLNIEFDPSGLVMLEQDDSSGNIDRVALHPAHVEHIAGRLGLIRHGTANAMSQVATLRRRMQTLKDRIDRLDDMLSLCGEHENLESEKDFSFASWEIAVEFCADFDEAFGKALSEALPEALSNGSTGRAETAPATAPETPDTRQLNLEGLQ